MKYGVGKSETVKWTENPSQESAIFDVQEFFGPEIDSE